MPVFAINFGAIGFLATVEPRELDEGFRRALRGEFDVLELPALLAATADGRAARGERHLLPPPRRTAAWPSWPTRSRARSSARCAATGWWSSTPAGSTGYNLANGGPVLAWGVEGYVVSFIAPHTLTARALVVAPDDVLGGQPLGARARST